MDLRDALSAELPPPREDEPAGLRQDILDELSDHLKCAYHRELLRGAHPAAAGQRVLNRFGDPEAVACRLWLDAMKGKIMAQRILVATCVVVALASLTLTGVIWRQSVAAQRQSAEAERRSAEMTAEALRAMSLQNERSQASQAEMLNQLRTVRGEPDATFAGLEPGEVQADRGFARRGACTRMQDHVGIAARERAAEISNIRRLGDRRHGDPPSRRIHGRVLEGVG